MRFLKDIGCTVKADGAGVERIGDQDYPVLEISPLVSYDGERLDAVKGKEIKVSTPTYVATLDDLKKLVA